MPTMLDMIEAVPRCTRRRMRRNGQHGVHFTCYLPMRYNAARGVWHCKCGGSERGGSVAARDYEERMAA